MAAINLNFEKINMQVEATRGCMSKIVNLIQEMEGYTDFMMKKIDAVSGEFQSSNYDRIKESLDECKQKLDKAKEDFDELLDSCKKVADKVDYITK